MKATKIVTGLLILFLAVSQVSAKGKGHCGKKGEGIKKELNLTDAQGVTLDSLRKAHREESKANHTKMQELRKSLPTIVDNRSEVVKVAEELAQLHKENIIKKADFLSSIKGILTVEQYTKFTKHMEKRMKRGHKRGEKGKCKKGRGKGCKGNQAS